MNGRDDNPARRLKVATIRPETSIADAMVVLDEAATGALVVTADGRTLYGLLTDGDVRRAIMRGVSLREQSGTIANRTPVVASCAIPAADALHLMTKHDISHLPLVDEHGELQGLLLRRDLADGEDLEESARERLESVLIHPSTPLLAAIARLDQAGTGALVLCETGRRLYGVLTDRDVRRAILHGFSLEDSCGAIANREPVTAHGAVGPGEALRLMAEHRIDHLPVVDEQGNVVEFLLRRDLIQEGRLSLSAVVMAGGYGTRLMPLTESVPKPMLPVGDRPLLERTIQQLRRSGIREVHLTTHYLSEAIEQHFGDGEAFGVKLGYFNEDQPLGTAGGLKQVKRAEGSFVVMNGDILTGVSFQDMLLYHREHRADMTIGVRKWELPVPFGVVDCDDVRVRALREKPMVTLFINAGIYLLEPGVCDYIPDGRRFDMTDLVQTLLDEGLTVVSYPIVEYWQDVGRHEDYQQAQEDARNGRI